MLRMPPPTMSYLDVLAACETAITGNVNLRIRFNNAQTSLTTISMDYSARAANATLFQLPQYSTGNPVVIDSLTKDELVNLYAYYFRDKRAGGYYDKLLLAANDQCPFCGGIGGQPANLDHFMPKGMYPQFSVLPVNLVPSCRDCNMGSKGDNFATSISNQILHPFLDADHFFNEQWIFARYNPAQGGQPSFMDYYVAPPESWPQPDRDRVLNHFLDFDIERRYRVQANAALGEIEAQIRALQQAMPAIDFKTVILQPLVSRAPFINHWKRVMCVALINDIL